MERGKKDESKKGEPEGTVEIRGHPDRRAHGQDHRGDLSWDLGIGELNPLHDAPDGGVSGAQARLRNLGYDRGAIDGRAGPRTTSALRRFQRDHDLDVSGTLDDPTRSALQKAHGC